jgi:CheY-like chemotaxis protein
MRAMDTKSRFRVLVVDDNPELLRSVRFALEALGNYEVETAVDGVEGLQRAVDLHPDCVIIDVKMPGINGNQLVTVLRGDPETAEIPLIILSALVQDDDVLRGHIAGVDQYLSKPFVVTDLIAAIERVTKMTPQERAARLQRLLDGDSDDHN